MINFTQFKNQVETLAKKPGNNFREIQSVITRYFRKFGVCIWDCSNLFVVRASKNDVGKVFENKERCSYNPLKEKIELQRCNYPQQQAFYCSMYTKAYNSSTTFTCIMETAIAEMKNVRFNLAYYTISRWNLMRPLKLWVLPFSKLSHQKNEDFRLIATTLKKALEKHSKRDEILTAFKYMSEVFCKRNNKKIYYKISSAFFNYLLFLDKIKVSECDGLAYPSANTERAGINVALKKELIDNQTLNCVAGTTYSLKRKIKGNKSFIIEPCSNTCFPDVNGEFSFEIIPDEKVEFLGGK